MLKIYTFKYTKLFLILCGSLFLYQAAYAQRAETTVERNENVKDINELYKQGKWEQGKRLAEDVLQNNPKDSDMRMLVGKYFLHRKNYDKARFELVKSLQYAPANIDVKHLLITVEAETQRYSSAICYINELLEVTPYWKGLWRKKIELYRNMNNHVEADRLLKRISQIYPEDSELKKDRGYLLEKRVAEVKKSGKVDQSIEISRRLVEEQPKQPDVYLSTIDNYIKAGDYNQALVYTERAINQFKGNGIFVQKKIAILEHQQRYPEILTLLDEQMKRGSNGSLKSQYNYLLLEAARNAKNNHPTNLYGKIFDQAAGNKEAFTYVFSELIAGEQYEQAISVLNRHRKSVGASKDLNMKELLVYRRMGNQAKVSALTKENFAKYPADADLRNSYVGVLRQEAKDNMQEGKINTAMTAWKNIIRYGDQESVDIARLGLYHANMAESRYQDAMLSLDELLANSPGDPYLLLKKSDLYHKQGRTDYALTIYEQALNAASFQDKPRYVVGYGELIAPLIKESRENFKLYEAKQLTERWLSVDEKNKEALLYMINISYQLKDYQSMLRYAATAADQNRDDVTFKIKLAEAMSHNSEKQEESWALLHSQVQLHPFHEPLVNSFTYNTEKYAGYLLKVKENTAALKVIDTGLHYKDNNKTLKYMKGLAYEGLKQFDSAYYYQKYYEPSLLEFDAYKNHLNYLAQKSFKNNVGISHLRARYGDNDAISTISTVEYGFSTSSNASYIARVNYAGRTEGKGVQGQLEWTKPWAENFSSRIDIALSNKFFAKYAMNAAALYEFKSTWEAEVGAGYRRFFSKQNLYNVNFGLTKDIADFRLSAKVSNFMLADDSDNIYLYNVGAKAQYFMGSPKSYLIAVGNIGNSPDIDLLNYQLINSFDVFNAMVGTGAGRLITPNIALSVMGTWYNFQSDSMMNSTTYRNLYNLYFQFNVSF